MQYLTIKKTDTLQTLSKIVGRQNADLVLNENGLVRSPKVGEQYSAKYVNYLHPTTSEPPPDVPYTRKMALLNGLSSNEEVFEKACLMDDEEWKFFSAFQSFKDAIKVPESITRPYSSRVIGSNIGNDIVRIGSNIDSSYSEGVNPTIYAKVMQSLSSGKHNIDPTIFSEVSTAGPVSLTSSRGSVRDQTRVPQYSYSLPWGKIQLYSSILNEMMDIPAYPEETETERSASYTAMPDIIYQYEPWIMYQSSGPREQSVEFHLHRDLWSGDHRDGRANELIRFCEANTFPKYTGSAVLAPTVKLYISGKLFISGVLTKTNVSWAGPLGLDDWYLEFTLRLTIQEVSETALNINTVRKMELIGV